MEDLLEVYQRPYDPRVPVVCLDEMPVQVLADRVEPLPMARGKPVREDYTYTRQGVATVFLAFEPLAGRRWVWVRERRTAVDWAAVVRCLLDEVYPEAERVVLVQDNLNTHTLGSLYKAFTPAEAGRLRRRLEVHYTPVRGSWLNMAEIELSVLERQCLDRRIGSVAALCREAAAWAQARNASCVRVDWQFTTADARIKLKHLYPKIEER